MFYWSTSSSISSIWNTKNQIPKQIAANTSGTIISKAGVITSLPPVAIPWQYNPHQEGLPKGVCPMGTCLWVHAYVYMPMCICVYFCVCVCVCVCV